MEYDDDVFLQQNIYHNNNKTTTLRFVVEVDVAPQSTSKLRFID